MQAAYAPLTFSWRGSHSGGWISGLVLVMSRKPAQVIWRLPEPVKLGAGGGFDLDSTLVSFAERIGEMTETGGSPIARLESLCSEWSFATIQIGDPQVIQGEAEKLANQALRELSLPPV